MVRCGRTILPYVVIATFPRVNTLGSQVQIGPNGTSAEVLAAPALQVTPNARSDNPDSLGDGYAKFDEIETISPESVAAMEIYPRVSEAPQNIVRLREGCGVILVWTKFYVESHRSPRDRRAGADSSEAKR